MSCITLLSDFGLQDASVAIAKGELMQLNPGLPVVDISHEVLPFHLAQAAYVFGCAYKKFPVNTCHVLLFDLFSEPVTRLILSRNNGHLFLSPDNGIIPLALGAYPEHAWQCFEIKKENTFPDWLREAGRIINQVQSKKPDDLKLPAYQLKTVQNKTLPVMSENTVLCEVIHIDHYENVVTNITKEQFETLGKGRRFRLQFVRVEEINEISNNYNEVRPGYKLCRFNSNGYLEICINRGPAASLFGLRTGSKHNEIKLYFE